MKRRHLHFLGSCGTLSLLWFSALLGVAGRGSRGSEQDGDTRAHCLPPGTLQRKASNWSYSSFTVRVGRDVVRDRQK